MRKSNMLKAVVSLGLAFTLVFTGIMGVTAWNSREAGAAEFTTQDAATVASPSYKWAKLQNGMAIYDKGTSYPSYFTGTVDANNKPLLMYGSGLGAANVKATAQDSFAIGYKVTDKATLAAATSAWQTENNGHSLIYKNDTTIVQPDATQYKAALSTPGSAMYNSDNDVWLSTRTGTIDATGFQVDAAIITHSDDGVLGAMQGPYYNSPTRAPSFGSVNVNFYPWGQSTPLTGTIDYLYGKYPDLVGGSAYNSGTMYGYVVGNDFSAQSASLAAKLAQKAPAQGTTYKATYGSKDKTARNLTVARVNAAGGEMVWDLSSLFGLYGYFYMRYTDAATATVTSNTKPMAVAAYLNASIANLPILYSTNYQGGESAVGTIAKDSTENDVTADRFIFQYETDNTLTSNVEKKSITNAEPGVPYTITYSGANMNSPTLLSNTAETSYTKYLSVVLWDKDGKVAYTGRLGEVKGMSGSATITFPSDITPYDTYTMGLVEETCYNDTNISTCSKPSLSTISFKAAKLNGIKATYSGSVKDTDSIQKNNFTVQSTYNGTVMEGTTYSSDNFFVIKTEDYEKLKTTNPSSFDSNGVITAAKDTLTLLTRDLTLTVPKLGAKVTSGKQSVTVVAYTDGKPYVTTVDVLLTNADFDALIEDHTFTDLASIVASAKTLQTQIDTLQATADGQKPTMITLTNKIWTALDVTGKDSTDSMTMEELTTNLNAASEALIADEKDNADKLASAQTEINTIKADLATMTASRNSLQTQLADAKTAYDTLKASYDSLAASSDSSAELTKLTAQVTSLNTTITSLNKDVTAMTTGLTGLETLLGLTPTAGATTDARYAEVKKAIEALQTQYDKVTSDYNSVLSKVYPKNADGTTATASNVDTAKVGAVLDSLVTVGQNANAVYDQCNALIEKAKTTGMYDATTLAALSEELAKVKNMSTDLSTNAALLSSIKSALNLKDTATTNDVLQAIAGLKTQITTLTADKNSLTTQVATLSTQVATASNNTGSVQQASQIASLQSTVTTLTAQTTTLLSDNKTLTAENKTLTTQAAQTTEITSKNKTLTTENAELTADNTSLTTANTSLTSRVKELKSDNASLTTANSKLSATNEKLTTANATLKTENNSLSNQVERLQSTESNTVSKNSANTTASTTVTHTVATPAPTPTSESLGSASSSTEGKNEGTNVETTSVKVTPTESQTASDPSEDAKSKIDASINATNEQLVDNADPSVTDDNSKTLAGDEQVSDKLAKTPETEKAAFPFSIGQIIFFVAIITIGGIVAFVKRKKKIDVE